MFTAIYKPGQGFYTRTMTAVGVGLVGGLGALWIWDMFIGVPFFGADSTFSQLAATIVMLAIFGVLIYWFVGVKPKAVDFLVATEGEMKKVNWSTRKEIINQTIVVIGLTFFLAIIIFVLDYLLYTPFFTWIGVLEST